MGPLPSFPWVPEPRERSAAPASVGSSKSGALSPSLSMGAAIAGVDRYSFLRTSPALPRVAYAALSAFSEGLEGRSFVFAIIFGSVRSPRISAISFPSHGDLFPQRFTFVRFDLLGFTGHRCSPAGRRLLYERESRLSSRARMVEDFQDRVEPFVTPGIWRRGLARLAGSGARSIFYGDCLRPRAAGLAGAAVAVLFSVVAGVPPPLTPPRLCRRHAFGRWEGNWSSLRLERHGLPATGRPRSAWGPISSRVGLCGPLICSP